MITLETTLIVGAGASANYGLPTGKHLLEYLIHGTASTKHSTHPFSWLRRNLINIGFHETDLDEFSQELENSQLISIDEFLSRRHEFSKIGKNAISLLIKRKEDIRKLSAPNDINDHWYRHLWNKLVSETSWESLKDNKLSIITFNYDRSLETFLSTVMKSAFGRSFEECMEYIQENVHIEHVYGKVYGDYGLPRDPGETEEEWYLHPPPEEIISKSADQIEIIPEGRNETPTLTRCHELIEHSKKMCFLGFGFDKTNMERLKLPSIGVATSPGGISIREVYGTAKSIPPRKAKALRDSFYLHNNKDLTQVFNHPPEFVDCGCSELLESWLVLEQA